MEHETEHSTAGPVTGDAPGGGGVKEAPVGSLDVTLEDATCLVGR